MNIKLNDNYKNLTQNYLFSEIAGRVKAYAAANPDKRIIRLGIGDVTLPLSPIVVEAMHTAVSEMGRAETFRGYAPEWGYDFTKEAVARHYAPFGITLSKDEIFISDGAKSDLGNLTEILGNNPVYIPDPVYPVYIDSNVMSGRSVTLLPATQENGFLPMPPQNAEGAVFYLCSPNNPTGAVYDRKQLQQWVDFANRTGSLILFDSAYEAFIEGDYPHSVFEIDGARTCAIEICSLSKTAGFTGTRCGWTIIPSELESKSVRLNQMWSRRQATKFNGVPYIVQRAAEAALSAEGMAACMKSIEYYKGNAKILANLFDEKSIFYTGGKCSPYIWLRCPGNMKSWEFFDYLLNEAQIVGTPGEGFGQCGEGYFRLTAFGSREATAEAAERMRKLF